MQCVTLLVGQIVTVIVDDQLQLGALRQLGRFVEVQSPVLHTRAQRRHAITVRPPTVGWQADRENGYGRAPINTGEPGRTRRHTDEARDGRNPLIGCALRCADIAW